MPGSQDFIRVATRRQTFLSEQELALAAAEARYTADIDELWRRSERNQRELIGYLVPDIDHEELLELERRFETTGLITRKQEAEAQLAMVEARFAALSAMHEVQHATALLAEAEQKLADVTPTWETLSAWKRVTESNQWFIDLDTRGYFHPDYEGWFIGHLRDWRSVSLLMADLRDHQFGEQSADFDNPDELKEWWLRLQQEHADVDLVVTSTTEHGDTIQQLVTEHEALSTRPAELLAELHDALGRHLIDHLTECPEETLLRLIADDPVLVTFLKKLKGMAKQVAYLGQLRVSRIQAQRQSLDIQIRKLNKKIAKARYKQKHYSAAALAKLGNVKEQKWAKRHARIETLRDRVVTFEKWDNGGLTQQFLWWDLMTRGARADDIWEVRTFHRDHPNWDYRDYRDPLSSPKDDGAMAVGAAMALDTAADALAEDLRGETVDLLGDIS